MDLLTFYYFLTKIEFICALFLYHFLARCIMASLSSKENAALRTRVCELDADFAILCAAEELGADVAIPKAKIWGEIQKIHTLISTCEEELARPSAASRSSMAEARSSMATALPPMAEARSSMATARPPMAATRSLTATHTSATARQPMAATRLSMATARSQVAPRPLVADSPQRFMEAFLKAVQSMASSGVPTRFSNRVFTGECLPVRGDGNCGLRAFLTALAARAGINLSIDPPGMLEWIFRLKLLMIEEINRMLGVGIIAVSDLLSIPENRLGAGATLNRYFALFRTDGYNITNFDFRVLASMFNLQINVIRETTNGIDDVQCFVRPGNEIDLVIAQHICILQQPGHFVPLIQVDEHLSSKSIECLYNALALGFTC